MTDTVVLKQGNTRWSPREWGTLTCVADEVNNTKALEELC